MNLLKETIGVLDNYGKTELDVEWVGFEVEWDGFEFEEGSYTTWQNFKEISNFDYDNGYGGEKIAFIVVVGKNFWLERHEYDGSEWWEFKTMPKKPSKQKEFTKEDIMLD